MINRLILLLFAILFCHTTSIAQYATPGTGVKWTMSDLVQNSNGAVLQPALLYRIHQSITISANDTLYITEVADIGFDKEVLLTIEGTFIVEPSSRIYFVALYSGDGYPGLRFEEGSSIRLHKASFHESGGIKCLTADFLMDSCEVKYTSTRQNTGGALEFLRGKPVVKNTLFESNQRAAISSGANVHVAPILDNNRFIGNSAENTNRPQINLGPSGPDDTTLITSNLLTGVHTMAGGIAFSSLLAEPANARIINNQIENNRYGIAVTGSNIRSEISGNIILNNNIQNLPFQGGSGININTSASGNNFAYISENRIEGNLWGITLQGNATANLGDTSSTNYNVGRNEFYNNTNEGQQYAVFNNTPNDVPAMNNCWIRDESYAAEDAEDVISHSIDDASLGTVFFEPFYICSSVSAIEKEDAASISIYPNPARENLIIENLPNGADVELIHISGKSLIKLQTGNSNNIQIQLHNIPDGLYVVKVMLNQFRFSQKILILH